MVPAIVAALPREVASLVRGVKADAELKRLGVHLYQSESRIVVCAGMGSERVTLAIAAALKTGAVSKLVSAGLAGACHSEVVVGAVLEAGTVIDLSSGARFVSGADCASTLATAPAIAGVREKARLHAAYGASMVDMEAATVARLAEIHGLPFRAIKGVSDAHDFELSALSRFASPHGHFRTGAFALHTALRPASWRHAMRLGAGSQRALAALANVLGGIG